MAEQRIITTAEQRIEEHRNAEIRVRLDCATNVMRSRYASGSAATSQNTASLTVETPGFDPSRTSGMSAGNERLHHAMTKR